MVDTDPVVTSISRHALDRYRRHFPEATHADLRGAVQLALPIGTHAARALVGRGIEAGGAPGDLYRLHLDGRGIFVLCPLPGEPLQHFVRTYLRLDGAEQQRIARSWFLDPLPVLQRAFELGFDAARRPEAPPLAVQASQAARSELATLAPLLGSVPPLEDQPDSPGEDPGGELPPLDVRSPLPLTERALDRLNRFRRAHTHFVLDLGRWQWLTPEGLARIRVHFSLGSPVTHRVLLEPGALAIAVVEGRAGGEQRIDRVLNLPRQERSVLPGHTLGTLDDDPPPDVPVEPAPSGDLSAREGAADGDETSALVVPMLAVGVWSAVALQEAEACGLGFIPPAWLADLTPLPPDRVPWVAARLGWRLQAPATYAALRHGDCILLLRKGEDALLATVLRCGRLLEVDELE